jgi:TonB family protein
MPADCMTGMSKGFPAGVAAPDGVEALEDVEPPRRLHSPPPEMPRRGPTSGYACVQATIDADGRVVDPRILGTNSPEYAANAVRALSGWRFAPATLDGAPVSVYYHLFVQYNR